MIIFAQLTDNDFITAIAALIFWVGGYAAAPVIFMATLGIFRNIAGMGTGMLKQARGKLGDRANARFRADKKIRAEERERRIAHSAQRSKLNYRERRKAGLRGTLRGEAATVGRSSRSEWGEAETAILGAKLAQGDPSVQKGHAVEQAAKIQASAGEINIQLEYEKKYESILKESPGMSTKKARDTAMQHVRKNLTDKLDNGTATQSELSGGMIFFGKQKSNELFKIQEHIGGMEPGSEQAKASNMYHSALGNGDVWTTSQAMSPGLQNVPGSRQAGETADQAIERVKADRRAAATSAGPQKLIAMTEPGWNDAFSTGRTTTDRSGNVIDVVDEAAMLDAARQLGPEEQKRLNLPKSVREKL